LIIGSFLNTYIFRLSRKEKLREKDKLSLWWGRSICPHCKKNLTWYELIPLFSFIFQRGRCRGCQQKIDWQYPLLELGTAIFFVIVFYKISLDYIVHIFNKSPSILDFLFFNFRNFFDYTLGRSADWQFSLGMTIWFLDLIRNWYFLAILLILFVYDLRYGLIPTRLIVTSIVGILIFNSLLFFLKLEFPERILFSVFRLLLAILLGAAFFASQYYFSGGRWVGEGDIYFGALIGAMVGWPFVFIALFLAYLIGGLASIILLLIGKKKFGETIPLGPFLALGTILTLLFGEQLWHLYFDYQ
jgi:prepilin signal peptidase PulO-like enzyme (type II secretory pathway)